MLHKILLIIILIVGLIVAVYLGGQKTGFFSKADILVIPQEIKITNITDNAFSISWITAKPTTGFVKYGENNNLLGTATDDRDQGVQKLRLTHHVTLKNLEPGKVNYFKIFSGASIFDNKGKPFEQVTAPITENPPAVPEPIFGKVINEDGNVPQEVLVYIQIPGGSLLSSYTREKGNWLITLNNARTKDLANYMIVQDSDQIDATFNSGEGRAETKASLDNKNSFATVTLEAGKALIVGDKKIDNQVQDYNQDGAVNIFDYVVYLKQRI